jgi:transposase
MLAVGLVHRECRYQSKMATQVEKASCVIWFIETDSASTVHSLYGNARRKIPPTRKIIYAWRKQLEETGCLCKGKSPGRPRVADDTVEAVRRSYMISSSKLTNCASRELDITQPTVWKILRKRLKTRPYKIQLLQAPVSQLTGTQRARRGKSFCTTWT